MLLLANQDMNTVPRIFIERVGVCLDRSSFLRNRKISSTWGRVFSATGKKVHTLSVLVDEDGDQLYAAALPAWSDDLDEDGDQLHTAALPAWSDDSDKAIPLDNVKLKFITNFRIESLDRNNSGSCASSSPRRKEGARCAMTTNVLEINHTSDHRPISLSHWRRSTFSLARLQSFGHGTQADTSCNVGIQLLSMRLPVDSVELLYRKGERAETEDFFQNTGPLYFIDYLSDGLKASTVDAIIENYVPVDGGSFSLDGNTYLTRKQLERLVLKCEMSDQKVKIGGFLGRQQQDNRYEPASLEMDRQVVRWESLVNMLSTVYISANPFVLINVLEINHTLDYRPIALSQRRRPDWEVIEERISWFICTANVSSCMTRIRPFIEVTIGCLSQPVTHSMDCRMFRARANQFINAKLDLRSSRHPVELIGPNDVRKKLLKLIKRHNDVDTLYNCRCKDEVESRSRSRGFDI
uniref:Inositol-pentakisphosphate 2-kinase n=1 Tax=Steinernema glaseri TaxID=37863 RepID=A0A1I7ZD46_9BILA